MWANSETTHFRYVTSLYILDFLDIGVESSHGGAIHELFLHPLSVLTPPPELQAFFVVCYYVCFVESNIRSLSY